MYKEFGNAAVKSQIPYSFLFQKCVFLTLSSNIVNVFTGVLRLTDLQFSHSVINASCCL